MSSRERWLAAVKMQPVDRLPFWPKLDAAYPRAQTGRFKGMPVDEIHRWIGSDMHVWGIPPCVRDGGVSEFVAETDGPVKRLEYRGPKGTLTAVYKWDEASQSYHPVEFPVKTKDDIELMREYYEGLEPQLDTDAVEKARAIQDEIGGSGVSQGGVGESPLMHFVEWIAGVENAHYLLADTTAEVEALFDAMHAYLLRRTEIFAEHSTLDLIYFVENTSTTLISPAQYDRYCARHITEYGEILKARDRNMVLHMCGHLKALLPSLNRTPADAFEAFTSAPVGNTSLEDGRSDCPDKCLIGGTNAVTWTKDAVGIIAEIESSLNALPHHRGVVVTSAGVMPPLCPPEKIKEIRDWVANYRLN